MKTSLSLIIVLFFVGISYAEPAVFGCPSFSWENPGNSDETELVDFYLQYSTYTDPGEYAYLYEELPDSLEELCSLIKSQFIHPYAELQRYKEQIPRERWNESYDYPTVESILEGLTSLDPRGFVSDRKPADRLILGCQEWAIVLASVMKYRGIPTRVRCGHAAYIRPGFNLSHTICEVWNEKKHCWILVDPGFSMVDFDRDKFEFSYESWNKMQNGELDLSKYGFPGRYPGDASIIGKISPDLAAILGTEYPVNHYAPILDVVFDPTRELTADHIEMLNHVCELMKSLDAGSIRKLQLIYEGSPEIQVSKTFMPPAVSK